MAASALLGHHPAVTHYLRYVTTAAGYDKVLRTTQYFAKFYAWYLYRTNTRMSSIQSWTTLNNQLSLTRKILRVRKVLELLLFHSDIYEAVINASHSDKVFQTLQLLRQIGYSGYMFFDVLAVLDAISAKKDSRVALIQAVAYHFWFTGLSASALGAIYTKYLSRDGLSGVDGAEVERVKVVRQQKIINNQLFSDLCDLAVSSTALGYASLDGGIVGLAGTMSSVLRVCGAQKLLPA